MLKINMPIPEKTEYPWEDFLRNNFGEDLRYFGDKPVTLADIEPKTGTIRDAACPNSYLALFRFLEFLRKRMEQIEVRVPALEDKLKLFKLLAKQHLDARQVDRKALYQEINNTLMAAYNLVSYRGHLETLFHKLTQRINKSIRDSHECNIMQLFGQTTMEKEFSPEYQLLIRKVPELLKIEQKIEAIDRQQRHFHLPGSTT